MQKQTILIKSSLFYNYALLSLLLNSVGIVILQVVSRHLATITAAGWLEAFKDGSILITSFIVGSYIPNFGYKRSMLFAIVLEGLACLYMALDPSFIGARIFFVLLGMSFAIIKVSLYSTVGLITFAEKEHASLISLLEGGFMLGTFITFFIFGAFVDRHNWQHVYWILMCLCVIGFAFLCISPLDESQHNKANGSLSILHHFKQFWYFLFTNFFFLFAAAIFCYVFVEQGINTWLPTYNHSVFFISKDLSSYLTSLLPIGLALGRFGGGYVFRKITGKQMMLICLTGALLTLAFLEYQAAHQTTQHQQITSWLHIPFSAYAVVLLGLFMGPLYPAICSRLLNLFEQQYHASVTILIILFSALGGTIGSRLIAALFAYDGGLSAFRLPLIPIILLMLLTIPLFSKHKKRTL